MLPDLPRPLLRHALAPAIGALSATGFAPLGWWPVLIVSFALLAWLVGQSPSRWNAFLTGWLFGVGHFTVGNNWIATAFTYQAAMPAWLGGISVFLLSLYLALFPALAALLTRMVAPRPGWAFTFAFAGGWIVTEWLRSWVFTGFAWNPLAVIWIDSPFSLLSRIVGTYGLSGLTVLLAAALIPLAGWTATRFRLSHPTYGYAAPALLLALVGLSFLLQPSSVAGTGPRIAVVQPNIGQEEKSDPWDERESVRKTIAASGAAGEGSDGQPRMLFWPEAGIPDFLERGYPTRYYQFNIGGSPEISRRVYAGLLGPGDLLISGATRLEVRNGRAVGARNGVAVLNTKGEVPHFYSKAHLVPYGEYLPMRGLLEPLGLSRLVPGTLDFWPGPGPQSYDLGAFGRMGVQICYEIVFSGQVVERGNRPDFLFNPSNDAWFGSWGPPQHLAQARLRAMEEGLPVIRSTPTGISAVVDAKGRIVEQLATGQAGRIEMRMPAPDAPTPFARLGNILPLLLAVLMLLCVVALRRRSL